MISSACLQANLCFFAKYADLLEEAENNFHSELSLDVTDLSHCRLSFLASQLAQDSPSLQLGFEVLL